MSKQKKAKIDLDQDVVRFLDLRNVITLTVGTLSRREAGRGWRHVTLRELLAMDERDLLNEYGIGVRNFLAIKEELRIRGLKLRKGEKVPAKEIAARLRILDYGRTKTRVWMQQRREECAKQRAELKYTHLVHPNSVAMPLGLS